MILTTLFHQYRFITTLCILASAIMGSTDTTAKTLSTGIAAIVNDTPISALDIQKRTHLVIQSGNLPNTTKVQKSLAPEILKTLINEELQLQEAQRLNIIVTEEKIDEGFKNIAQANKKSVAAFTTQLQKANVALDSIRTQIKAQIAWNSVFAKSLSHKVRISPADIETYQAQLSKKIGKKEYLMFEIILPVKNAKEGEPTYEKAKAIAHNIVTGKMPFPAAANQFSRAPSAQNGGALGWIEPKTLPPELRKVVETMQPKSLSVPIRSSTGYHIIYVAKIRTLSKQDLPSAEKIRKILFAKRAERISMARLKSLRNAAHIDNRMAR